MKRVFTKTIPATRWKAGMLRDWPMSTWRGFAESVRMALDEFTKPYIEPEARGQKNAAS